MKFNNGEPLTLESERLIDSDFSEKIKEFFSSRELGIVRSEHNWKRIFINTDEEILGCVYPDDRDLYKSTDDGKSVIFIKRFPNRIKSIFISSEHTIFVCVIGAVIGVQMVVAHL